MPPTQDHQAAETSATQYNIEGSILEEVQHHPYLGVEITSDLTWKTHIANISGKANRILNLLRRHIYGCSLEVKSRAITTLVRPHLEYSSTVWDPYYCNVCETLICKLVYLFNVFGEHGRYIGNINHLW